MSVFTAAWKVVKGAGEGIGKGAAAAGKAVGKGAAAAGKAVGIGAGAAGTASGMGMPTIPVGAKPIFNGQQQMDEIGRQLNKLQIEIKLLPDQEKLRAETDVKNIKQVVNNAKSLPPSSPTKEVLTEFAKQETDRVTNRVEREVTQNGGRVENIPLNIPVIERTNEKISSPQPRREETENKEKAESIAQSYREAGKPKKKRSVLKTAGDVVKTVATAAGLGLTGYGAIKAMQAQDKASEEQKEILKKYEQEKEREREKTKPTPQQEAREKEVQEAESISRLADAKANIETIEKKKDAENMRTELLKNAFSDALRARADREKADWKRRHGKSISDSIRDLIAGNDDEGKPREDMNWVYRIK
jgi:hypothetical protein